MTTQAVDKTLALPEVSIPSGEMGAYWRVRKFGFSSAVGTTEETIWEQSGRYSWPSSASTMTVSSDDANDTAAGTGARTVQIEGLDSDYLEVDETVTLNGQTEVATTNSYIRVHRAIVRAAGSGETNAGVIYVGTGTVTLGVPANVYTTIAAGEGQTLQSFYTIPANRTGYLRNVKVSSFGNANAYITARLRVRPEGEVFQTKDKFIITRAAPDFPRHYGDLIPSKADIELTATANTGTLDASGSFELVLRFSG